MTTLPESERPATGTRSRSGFLGVVGWVFTMDGGGQALSLIISFILAGILGPRTYGVVAMAIVYITFMQMIQRQGMAAAIIQRKELSGKHLDTAFWLVLGVSGVLTASSLALAGWWAGVNDLPELQPIIAALSGLVVIEALTTVQMALLTRHMRFRDLAARRIIGVVAGGIAGLTGALLGWAAWAIVAQQLVMALVSLIVLWTASGWRPRLRFSRHAARDLLGFSTGSFLSSIGVFANNRADVLIVGLFFGPVVVGIYQLASRLVDTVVMIASRPVQTLALPELSPHQDEPDEFARRIRRLMRVSAVVALPALGLLAASAPPLVDLLGAEWHSAVAVLQILCVVGLVRVVIVLDGPLLQALGRPFLQAGITWLAATVSVATFTAAGLMLQDIPQDRQALLVAVSRAVIYGMLIVAIHLFIIRRFTSLAQSSHSVYAVPLIAGLAAAGAGIGIALLLNPAFPPLATLATSAPLSGAIAALVLLRWQPNVRSILVGAFSKKYQSEQPPDAQAPMDRDQPRNVETKHHIAPTAADTNPERSRSRSNYREDLAQSNRSGLIGELHRTKQSASVGQITKASQPGGHRIFTTFGGHDGAEEEGS